MSDQGALANRSIGDPELGGARPLGASDLARMRREMEDRLTAQREREAERERWEKILASEGMPANLDARDARPSRLTPGQTAKQRRKRARRRANGRPMLLVRAEDGRQYRVRAADRNGNLPTFWEDRAVSVAVIPREYLTGWERAAIRSYDREYNVPEDERYTDCGPLRTDEIGTVGSARVARASSDGRPTGEAEYHGPSLTIPGPEAREDHCVPAFVREVSTRRACSAHENCHRVRLILEGEQDMVLGERTIGWAHTSLLK